MGDKGLNQALRLDDNDFPKHIWSFIFRGKFPKHGPENYSLAHLADHKIHGNRFAEDFIITDEVSDSKLLFGLYTSAANAIYAPNTLIKPTDFAGPFRNLLIRRAHQLYREFCNILPEWISIPSEESKLWALDSFEWAEPLGTLDNDNMDAFLKFRNQTLEDLLSD